MIRWTKKKKSSKTHKQRTQKKDGRVFLKVRSSFRVSAISALRCLAKDLKVLLVK